MKSKFDQKYPGAYGESDINVYEGFHDNVVNLRAVGTGDPLRLSAEAEEDLRNLLNQRAFAAVDALPKPAVNNPAYETRVPRGTLVPGQVFTHAHVIFWRTLPCTPEELRAERAALPGHVVVIPNIPERREELVYLVNPARYGKECL